jgi:hypothetical protein
VITSSESGPRPDLRAEQREQRPEPLAPRVDQVQRGLGDER